MMNYEKIKSHDGSKIEGPLLIKPIKFEDSRGFFMEAWNQKKFDTIFDKSVKFVQDNFSHSKKGVVRGLHLQKKPHEQGKLVRCISGEIYDVIVDLRKDSITFAKWFGINLSSENNYQLWIPEGFAHGFLAISETAEISYKTTTYWERESEITIMWNEADIGIKWPLSENYIKNAIISKKDLEGISLSNYQNINFAK